MLKNFRVKTLKIFEDYRMSSACEMWGFGVFLATTYNFLKSVYIPVGAVEGLRRSCCVCTAGEERNSTGLWVRALSVPMHAGLLEDPLCPII
jgi:hypothetical protein